MCRTIRSSDRTAADSFDTAFEKNGDMTKGLVILLTNIWLDTRAGSETVTRDLAFGLLRRGHRPIVYSPTLGAAAQDIMTRGVPVVDDLRQIGEAPDLIHAHHSIPCGEALVRFPRVPAVLMCHAFDFWIEAPVRFPQIAAYLAVDEACRDRLVHKEGIDPAQVVMLPNAVDLSRIPPRAAAAAAASERLVQAAAFGKAAMVPEIRAACAQAGLDFTVLGEPAGTTLANPEHDLVQFDLVFATARSALEALCCGCAVIICDHRGMAGLVTTQNFEALRTRNFGLRSLGERITVQRLVDEIARYDPADAATVSQQARDAADLEKHLDRVESLYADVLSGSRRPAITAEAHDRAVVGFLYDNLPRRPNDPRWPWIGQREALESEIRSLEKDLAELSLHWSAANQERLALRQELDEAVRRATRLAEDHDAFNQRQLALGQELAEAAQRTTEVAQERDTLRQQLVDATARLVQAERKRDEVGAQLADAGHRLTVMEQNQSEVENRLVGAERQAQQLDTQLAAARHSAMRAEEGAARAEEDAARLANSLWEIKRSRLLRLGRWLRRLSGRTVPY
jgi:hypothetical protein